MTTDGASLAEPRSIVQSLISKFQAAADIAVIQEIDAAYERVQRARAQKLAASRDTLHRTNITSVRHNSLSDCRMDEKSGRCQVGGPKASR